MRKVVWLFSLWEMIKFEVGLNRILSATNLWRTASWLTMNQYPAGQAGKSQRKATCKATGWSKATVTNNFSLENLKTPKNGLTQAFICGGFGIFMSQYSKVKKSCAFSRCAKMVFWLHTARTENPDTHQTHPTHPISMNITQTPPDTHQTSPGSRRCQQQTPPDTNRQPQTPKDTDKCCLSTSGGV